MIEETDKLKHRKRERIIDLVLLFLIPLLMVFLLEGNSRNGTYAVFQWLSMNPFLFFCNYLLMLAMCLLLSVFRRQSVRALFMVFFCLLCSLFGIASYYKMLYRMEPVFLTDITQISDAMAVLTGLRFDIDIRRIAAWSVCGVLGMMIAFVGLKRFEHRRRWIPALFGVAMLVWLPSQYTFGLANGANRYDMVDHARNEGSLYTLIAMENHRQDLMHVDYHEDEVRAVYRDLQQKVQKVMPAETPNIVLILSESFADQAYLSKYLSLKQPLTPYYDTLMKESLSGQLRVPNIGGGTSESEFEVLTGLKSQYEINPYAMGLPAMNSMASVLREKGYNTTAIHWYAGVYYNRYNNLKKLGFDSFYTTDTTSKSFEKIGMFISDREHYASIMEQLKASDEKDFVFTLTMQNHGGYDYDDFRETYGAELFITDQLTTQGELIVNNFCYLVQQSDRALETFIEELREFDEPTMVVFFGDHIPPFGLAAYEELGISTKDEIGYLTPYFIWSNREDLHGELDMNAYQLGVHALTLAGMNDDPFMRYVEELREDGATKDEAYDLLSYDALFGKQYAYDEGALSPENMEFHIGGEMELLGFDAIQIGERIYLRPHMKNQNQKFKLLVNNQLRDTRYVPVSSNPLTLGCVMTRSGSTEYNRSNLLTFENTNDLLVKCGVLAYEELTLDTAEYSLIEEKSSTSYYLFRSDHSFDIEVSTAVLMDGEPWQWQPTYSISAAKQYGFDSEGRLYLAISKNQLRNSSSDSLKALLKEREAVLCMFLE